MTAHNDSVSPTPRAFVRLHGLWGLAELHTPALIGGQIAIALLALADRHPAWLADVFQDAAFVLDRLPAEQRTLACAIADRLVRMYPLGKSTPPWEAD